MSTFSNSSGAEQTGGKQNGLVKVFFGKKTIVLQIPELRV